MGHPHHYSYTHLIYNFTNVQIDQPLSRSCVQLSKTPSVVCLEPLLHIIESVTRTLNYRYISAGFLACKRYKLQNSTHIHRLYSCTDCYFPRSLHTSLLVNSWQLVLSYYRVLQGESRCYNMDQLMPTNQVVIMQSGPF